MGKGHAIETAELYFNTRTYFIEKLVLLYAPTRQREYGDAKPLVEAPRVEVEYNDIDLHPTFEADTFSESKFVVQSGGTWRPSKEYVDYYCSDSRMKR